MQDNPSTGRVVLVGAPHGNLGDASTRLRIWRAGTLLTEGVPMLSNFSALIGMAGIVVYAALLFNAVYNGVKNRPQMFYEQQLHLIQVSTVQTKTMQPMAKGRS